jgi:hypothetical protein
MYVRIARFEGTDPSRIDEQIAELRQAIEGSRSGNAPPEAQVLMETVQRFVQLVDRETGATIGMAYCRTEDDLRRADEALNAMSPGEGGGRRTGVELYEVALDEAFG